MTKKIYLLGILFCLSACMKMKPKDGAGESPDATGPVSSAAVRPTAVSYDFVSGDESNEYQIKFHFNQPVSTVFVVKTVAGVPSSRWIDVQNNTWIDVDVAEGKTVQYEFGTLGSDKKFEKWYEVSFTAPQDLVLDQTISLLDPTFLAATTKIKGVLVLDKYHRIFLGPNARLVTEGTPFKILTQEVHSEGGRIETFEKGTTAQKGFPGRDGGSIEIQAERAIGNLTVEMRGENGGDGLDRKTTNIHLKGQKGDKGADAKIEQVGSYWDGTFQIATYRCVSQPQPGQNGHPGLDGEKGGHGYQGGSTGRLVLKIIDKSDFNINAVPDPGLYGRGGKGGRGGQGGDPGEPGSIPAMLPGTLSGCIPSRAGAPGENGKDGPPGDNGRSGVTESACHFDQANKIEYCYY